MLPLSLAEAKITQKCVERKAEALCSWQFCNEQRTSQTLSPVPKKNISYRIMIGEVASLGSQPFTDPACISTLSTHRPFITSEHLHSGHSIHPHSGHSIHLHSGHSATSRVDTLSTSTVDILSTSTVDTLSTSTVDTIHLHRGVYLHRQNTLMQHSKQNASRVCLSPVHLACAKLTAGASGAVLGQRVDRFWLVTGHKLCGGNHNLTARLLLCENWELPQCLLNLLSGCCWPIVCCLLHCDWLFCTAGKKE